MIFQASLIGGWEKLELWGHTHLALFALLILVCVTEVILLKITTSARLFTRPQHYDSDYDDDSGEYEEDIYYEEISGFSEQRTRQQEQHPGSGLLQQQQTQYSFINYNQTRDDDNHFINNNHSTSTDVFRFVY